MGEETDRHLTWPLICTACFNLVPRVLSPLLSYGFLGKIGFSLRCMNYMHLRVLKL